VSSTADKSNKKGPQKTVKVVHNLGETFLLGEGATSAIASSPLVELWRQYPDDIQLVPMLHNPEVQATSLRDSTREERQQRIRDRLVEAFVALEKLVGEDGSSKGPNVRIGSYGIVSNGLCLPSDHPLFLSHETVLDAAALAQSKLSVDDHSRQLSLSVVQLPANVLETTGIQVARDLREALKRRRNADETVADSDTAGDDKDKSEEGAPRSTALPESVASGLQVYAMRPLTCYPDRGTGEGYPFVLADYMLPATMEKQLVWTNEMQNPPAVYEIALKNAMRHFDAEEIIQLKVEGKDLTSDQRETLDGCKLMQSLLHDLDAGLDKVRSYAAHESDLYEKIIPLIHDTFEAYDEETAGILKSFFGAYSLAVRYAIARNTRKLLHEGEKKGAGGGKKTPKFSDEELPQEMRLQEFGLRFVLKERDLFSRVIVGSSQPEHVVDTVHLATKILSESSAAGEGKEE